MYIDLLNNLAITAALLYIAGKFFQDRPLDLNVPVMTRIYAGLGAGILGTLLMVSTIHVTDIVIVDLRHLALVVAGIFGGPVSSIVSGMIIGVMRVLLYGANAASLTAGTVAIVMGILFGFYSSRNISKIVKYVLMNVSYVSISSAVIYFFSKNDTGSIEFILYNYWFISLIAGIFTYFFAEYIKTSNENHRSIMHYKMIADNSMDLISTHHADGTFKYISPSCRSILGYEVAELIGKNPYDYYLPDDLEKIKISHETIMSTPDNYSVQYRFLQKDGSYIWLETTSRSMKDSQELLCITRDITQRKLTEEALKDSEKRYKQLVEQSPEGIIVHTQGKIVYHNTKARELLLGAQKDKLIGKPILQFIHPDFRQIAQKRVNSIQELGVNADWIEEKLVRFDGEVFDAEVTGAPVTYLNQRAAQTIFRDITNRKQIENQIRESEERYRRLIVLSPDPILIHDGHTILFVSDKATDLIGGADYNEIVGKSIYEFIHPDYHEGMSNRIKHLFETRQPLATTELKMRNLMGQIFDIEISSDFTFYKGKNASQVIIRNITERKRTEKALKESEERYRFITNNSSDMITLMSADGTNIFQSAACKRLIGYEPEELIGKSVFDKVHPEDLPTLTELHFEVMNELDVVTFSYRVRRKDGQYAWLESTARALRNEDGTLHEIHAVSRDITERKKMEEVLKESEERFRLLAEYSSDMITLHDAEGKYLYASPASKIILQYENEELVGQDAYHFIHPEDQEIIKRHHQTLLETGFIISTYRMRRKDGEYIWFESSIRVLHETHLEGSKLIVVSRNITERKLTEQKLQEANKLLQHLSTVDGLTGVRNRRSFDEMLEMEWNRAIRNSTSLSLIMIDIDHFKAYNDTYGHQAGDGCLKEVAQSVADSLDRSGDTVFRYGGEEFGVILPETDVAGAIHVAEKIRVAIDALNIPHSGSKVSDHVTISLGTATMVPTMYTSANDLVEAADRALYQAKQEGRNRVRTYERSIISN
ncbi:PAS domain S-box protein [Ammoniphilus sp. CFH 90114]|uniref:PAS domain S-box protein n=1 Tax=Ammoniphilus sp. CFH 90114 TaxID=2493665 RepID=UPI00100E3EC9|nr:PAS domain S-box protein [Ammoniphilus sp. CFH 90114]RXT07936.1 PAS domain S-box protein [Ammoniphilus sp. CFH 90114]